MLAKQNMQGRRLEKQNGTVGGRNRMAEKRRTGIKVTPMVTIP